MLGTGVQTLINSLNLVLQDWRALPNHVLQLLHCPDEDGTSPCPGMDSPEESMEAWMRSWDLVCVCPL